MEELLTEKEYQNVKNRCAYFYRDHKNVLCRMYDKEDLIQECIIVIMDCVTVIKPTEPQDRAKLFNFRITCHLLNCLKKAISYNENFIPQEQATEVGTDDTFLENEEELKYRTDIFVLFQSELNKMKPVYQKVFTQRFFEGKSFQEIADSLEISKPEVHRIYRYGMRNIKNKIGEKNGTN
jgi:RNA polymerase sigma factor (sigma-70 family)